MSTIARVADWRSPLGRLLRLPLRLIPARAVLPVLSGPLRGARWISGASNAGCWLGRYERENQRFLEACLRPSDTFIDVGANVGFFSLLASRLVGPTGAVLAFEPVPATAEVLRSHLRLNGRANVTVLEVALAERAGRQRFTMAGSHSCAHLDAHGALAVEVDTLDNVLRHPSLPSPRLIKIDVEGAEALVVAGASELLQGRPRPSLLIATHGWRAHEETLRLLVGHGLDPMSQQMAAASGNGQIYYRSPD